MQKKQTSAPKKRKGERADGLLERTALIGGQRKHFYGHTNAELRDKIEAAQRAYFTAQQQTQDFSYVAEEYEKYITGPAAPIRRGTVRNYRVHIVALHDRFDGFDMAAIDAQAIHIYFEWMKKQGLALKTIINRRSVLSRVFDYWCTRFHGDRNPTALAGLPSGMKRGERLPPTDAQIAAVDSRIEDAGYWAQLFKYAGVRLGEANALRWSDIDFTNKVITIDHAMPWDSNTPYSEDTKTAKGNRTVPILDAFLPILRQWKKGHKSNDFLLSGTDKPLTQSQYNRRWIAYCRTVGIAESYDVVATIPATNLRPNRKVSRKEWRAQVTAHQFRHLYATILFEAGVPDLVAQQLLGHADIMTTRRIYQTCREKTLNLYTAQLNDYVNKSISTNAAQ